MLEHLIGKSVEEKDKEIRGAFQDVFSTEKGILALTAILHELCYFVPTVGEGPQACNNAAKVILGECNVDIASKIFGAWKNLMAMPKEKKDGE